MTGLMLSTSADPPPARQSESMKAVQRAVLAALLAVADPKAPQGAPAELLEHSLEAIRDALDYERRPDHRRTWLLISLVTAVIRGILADSLVTDPRGFRAINDEDFGHWILRHGGHPDVLEFPLVRGFTTWYSDMRMPIPSVRPSGRG